FFTFDSLRSVSLKGGAPLMLAPVVNPIGGTWCDDGTIYYAGDEGDSLWQIRGVAPSGERQVSQVPLDTTLAYTTSSYPQCLPGSRGLLVSVADAQGVHRSFGSPLSFDNASVGLLGLPARERRPRVIVSRGYAAQYAASGHLVFARGGGLVAAPFDL